MDDSVERQIEADIYRKIEIPPIKAERSCHSSAKNNCEKNIYHSWLMRSETD